MEIKKHILNSYTTIDPFAATTSLEARLLEKGYVVIADDDDKFQGILTVCDLIKRPHKIVIDCLTEKEHLSADDSIISSLNKFDSNQSCALPVFKESEFVGILERQEVVDVLGVKIDELHDESILSQKVKQSFLNNLSHEVRTPLNGLLGFLELISELNIEGDNTERKAYYNVVRKSANRFLLILNDLIDLALMDSGNDIKVEIEKINIECIFSDLKEYFEMTMLVSNRNISVDYVNPDSSFVFWSDGKKVKHILYHLIDNAIKFSNDSDKVICGYRVEGLSIIFFVKNNGTQISKDKKEKIFEIFEKQDYHNNELVEGLGIGLPLVKKLSKLLKGEIELVTNETQTTFYCTFPLRI